MPQRFEQMTQQDLKDLARSLEAVEVVQPQGSVEESITLTALFLQRLIRQSPETERWEDVPLEAHQMVVFGMPMVVQADI